MFLRISDYHIIFPTNKACMRTHCGIFQHHFRTHKRKDEVKPSLSFLVADPIFFHLLKSQYPHNFEVQPALKKPAVSLSCPGKGLAKPCRTEWKEDERGLEEEWRHFPRGPCMCKQLYPRPKLWGINKLLRKQ